MPTHGHPLIIIGSDRTLFQVNVSESFTIPDAVSTLSPTADYVPSGVAGSFSNKRPGVGGQLILAQKDGAGPSNLTALEFELQPGDVVALSAVVSNVVTVSVNSEVKHRITSVTAAASVIGVYG